MRLIDKLKSSAKHIHYFGLGFIQIKVNAVGRYHIYTPSLPAITEDIHNHRYNFKSTILAGKLIQYIFNVKYEDYGDYVIEQESCKEEKAKGGVSLRCSLKAVSTHTYTANSYYTLDADVFHRVGVGDGGCVTFLNTGFRSKEYAEVIHTFGREATCPFSKKLPEKELWEIVEREFNIWNL